MKQLRYYVDTNNDVLSAYEKSTEFFVIYNPSKGEWVDSGISFLSFKHDYSFKEISEKDVSQRTNGNLPTSKFQAYLDMLNKNMGYTNG